MCGSVSIFSPALTSHAPETTRHIPYRLNGLAMNLRISRLKNSDDIPEGGIVLAVFFTVRLDLIRVIGDVSGLNVAFVLAAQFLFAAEDMADG